MANTLRGKVPLTDGQDGGDLADSSERFQRQGWSIQHYAHVQSHLEGIGKRSRKPRRFAKSSLQVLKATISLLDFSIF